MAFRADDNNSNTYARFPVEVVPQVTNITSADGTTPKLIVSNPTTTLGYRLDLLLVTTNDNLSNIMTLYLHNGTTLSSLPFAFCTIPNESGIGVTNHAVSVLRSTNLESTVNLDNNGNPFIMLGVGWSIYAAMTNAVSATKTVQVAAWSHSY